MTASVHTFSALVSIHGMHPRLMPDLTASIDLAPAAAAAARGLSR
jgi:hypothetical protein